MTLLLAFLLGVVSGLRSLTPAAVLAWAVQGHPELQGTLLSFMSGAVAAYALTALALIELVTDKLPFTPSRLTPLPLIARILMGALCGATVAVASGGPLAVGAVVGASGGFAGAFLGYHVRRDLTDQRAHLLQPGGALTVLAAAQDVVRHQPHHHRHLDRRHLDRRRLDRRARAARQGRRSVSLAQAPASFKTFCSSSLDRRCRTSLPRIK